MAFKRMQMSLKTRDKTWKYSVFQNSNFIKLLKYQLSRKKGLENLSVRQKLSSSEV